MHPHPRAQPHGPDAAINPNNYYTSQPAPMGIADFGLDGHGNPYSYTTSEFLGQTFLRNFSADSGGDPTISIQLNVCFQFTVGINTYQFWIQDVTFLDTSANSPTFLNNIWNLSTTNDTFFLASNAVSGNGTIYGNEFYYDEASGTGNGATLPAVSEIDLLVTGGIVNDYPAVAFEYQDGYGWQTYDNVIFPFAKGATDASYIVDGSSYAPDGLYDSAELDLGGPGGGSSAQVEAANFSLALSSWNGHNFQAVRNAYNFGSDTGESMSDVGTHRAGNATNATLGDQITYGNSPLGMLYSSLWSSALNVTTDVANSTLHVADGPGLAYEGNQANISIAPGTFTVSIYNATGAIADTNVTVPTGGFVAITLDQGPVYEIRFVEAGLFGNRQWTVSIGDIGLATKGTNLTFFMVNGSYAYAISRLGGFYLNDSTGTATVNGTAQTITAQYVPVLYFVRVYETGLPANTSWTITVFGQTFSTGGVSLSFGLPNGTWNYSMGLVAGWTANPKGVGVIDIVASSETLTIPFHRFRLPIVVQEAGLPMNTFWYVRIGSDWTNGSVPKLYGSEPNGTYLYRIVGSAGWLPDPVNGSVTVLGSAAFLNVSFLPFTFPVTFTEQGLPTGTDWGFKLGGEWRNTTNASEMLLLPNGTFSFTVGAIHEYDLAGSPNGSVVVDGAPVAVNFSFSLSPAAYGTVSGSISPAGAILTVDGNVTAYSGTTFVLRLIAGEHTIGVTLAGYHPYSQTIEVPAGGTVDLLPIVLEKIVTPPKGGTTTIGSNRSLTSGALPGPEVDLAFVGLAAIVLGSVAIGYALRGRRTRP